MRRQGLRQLTLAQHGQQPRHIAARHAQAGIIRQLAGAKLEAQLELLFAGIVTTMNNLSNQTATLEMPFWLFMAPLVVGSALLVVETFMTLVHTWRRKRPEDKHTVLT